MSKIVAVGEEVVISGFRGVGAELIKIDSSDKLSGVLDGLAHDTSVSLIMITETVAKDCLEIISSFREKIPAIIIMIPAHTGSLNLGLKEIMSDVEKAVGRKELNSE